MCSRVVSDEFPIKIDRQVPPPLHGLQIDKKSSRFLHSSLLLSQALCLSSKCCFFLLLLVEVEEDEEGEIPFRENIQ